MEGSLCNPEAFQSAACVLSETLKQFGGKPVQPPSEWLCMAARPFGLECAVVVPTRP